MSSFNLWYKWGSLDWKGDRDSKDAPPIGVCDGFPWADIDAYPSPVWIAEVFEVSNKKL
jgi:hypothetical protein